MLDSSLLAWAHHASRLEKLSAARCLLGGPSAPRTCRASCSSEVRRTRSRMSRSCESAEKLFFMDKVWTRWSRVTAVRVRLIALVFVVVIEVFSMISRYGDRETEAARALAGGGILLVSASSQGRAWDHEGLPSTLHERRGRPMPVSGLRSQRRLNKDHFEGATASASLLRGRLGRALPLGGRACLEDAMRCATRGWLRARMAMAQACSSLGLRSRCGTICSQMEQGGMIHLSTLKPSPWASPPHAPAAWWLCWHCRCRCLRSRWRRWRRCRCRLHTGLRARSGRHACGPRDRQATQQILTPVT